MTDETKGGGAAGATDLPAAEQLDSLRSEDASTETSDKTVLSEPEPSQADVTSEASEALEEEDFLDADEPAEPELQASDDEEDVEPVPEAREGEGLESAPLSEDAHEHGDDESSAPLRLGEEAGYFQQSRSEGVVAACTEIYALARTALEELSHSTSPYLTFQQKKRIHAHAARFGAEPEVVIPVTSISGGRQQLQADSEGSVSVDEIEKLVLSRVRERLGDELARLAGRAGATAAATGLDSDVGAKLDGLASALLELERSLPARIDEVVDSKLGSAGAGGLGIQPVLASVEEVRSVRPGFSIADLDLVEIAELSDRANQSRLPLLELEPSRPTSAPAVSESEPTRARAEEAPSLPSSQTAVVYLEDSTADAILAPSASQDFPEALEEAQDSALWAEDSGAIEDADLESIELDATSGEFTEPDEPIRLELDGGTDGDRDSLELDRAEVELEELETIQQPGESGQPEDEDGFEESPLPSTTGENVLLAPVVGDEESVELDLGESLEDIGSSDKADTEPSESENGDPDATAESPQPEGGEQTDTEVELRLQHAAELRGRGKLVEAMKQYDEVITTGGPHYEAHIGRGVVFLQTRNYERAAEEFAAAEEIDGTRPAGALGLAEVCFHQKNFAEAVLHYSSCIRLDPRLAQAFRNRGLCHYHQKDFAQAASDLRKAYELDPALPNIKKYLQIARNKLRTLEQDSAEASP